MAKVPKLPYGSVAGTPGYQPGIGTGGVGIGYGPGGYLVDTGVPEGMSDLPQATSPAPGIGSIGKSVGGPPGAPGGQDWLNVGGKPIDYSNILKTFLADRNARINAGLAAYRANRISNARAAINRLGVRDPKAMAGQLAQYGISMADLQAAADNPWSELKGIDKQAVRAGAMLEAQMAARGGWRSGGTIAGLEDIENERARTEAQTTQETLGSLSQGLYGESEWERQQRDEAEQAAAQMEVQLAGAYQPTTTSAHWDPAHGGYVSADGRIFDPSGNQIGTI